jgi:chorismate synthase
MSSFGRLYKVTTFGESHCNSVGVVIDGCPSNLNLTEADIQSQLDRRRPGQSKISTERKETDKVQILSGTERGKTLGSPICAIVQNIDMRPGDYKFDKNSYLVRPSHADLTYHLKYGIHASSGGGRSSARETISRVIAGTIAEKWMSEKYNIDIVAWVSSVGNINFDIFNDNYKNLYQTLSRKDVDKSIIRCPDENIAEEMIQYIEQLKEDGNTTGGIISCVCRNVPHGLGEPCFDKLEAKLSHAMLSIPSTKGFEIGSGFAGTKLTGRVHNDIFIKKKNNRIGTITNHSGGVQGGVTNGEDIYFKVAFKPVSTIKITQQTVDLSGATHTLKAKGRHDPCVVNRAIPIVESMSAMVIMDAILIQKMRTYNID